MWVAAMCHAVTEIADARVLTLRRTADKSTVVAILLGFFLPPLGYVYIGRYKLAILNLITLNWFLLGFIIVPLQTRSKILNARRELNAEGIPWP